LRLREEGLESGIDDSSSRWKSHSKCSACANPATNSTNLIRQRRISYGRTNYSTGRIQHCLTTILTVVVNSCRWFTRPITLMALFRNTHIPTPLGRTSNLSPYNITLFISHTELQCNVDVAVHPPGSQFQLPAQPSHSAASPLQNNYCTRAPGALLKGPRALAVNLTLESCVHILSTCPTQQLYLFFSA
jgi:hypothetical protein